MSSLVGVSGMIRNEEGKLICSLCGNPTFRTGALVVGLDGAWTLYGKCPCCNSSVVLRYDKNKNKNLKENLPKTKVSEEQLKIHKDLRNFEKEDFELLHSV